MKEIYFGLPLRQLKEEGTISGGPSFSGSRRPTRSLLKSMPGSLRQKGSEP